jgi:L-asparaginase II
MSSSVDVIRGGTVESRHRISAAAVDAAGKLVAWTGDPGLVTYWRSCAKPIQAVPLITDGAVDALGISDAEIALACASHNGEPRHVEVAAGLLAKAGCTEADLACGAHNSLQPAVARAMAERGETPRRIHSNCSGKHAAMLAQARFHGWPTEGYRHPGHPVQRRALAEVAAWTGVPEAQVGQGVDGCGVVSFALPLRSMALAYARLAAGTEQDVGGWPLAGGGGVGSANHQPPTANRLEAGRILAAIVKDPFLIAGTGRLCTEVVAATGGRVIAKIGADGVYCAVLRDAGLGLALKVEDGDGDSARPALLAVLDALAPGVVRVAESFHRPVIKNTLGEVVGHLEAKVELERGS